MSDNKHNNKAGPDDRELPLRRGPDPGPGDLRHLDGPARLPPRAQAGRRRDRVRGVSLGPARPWALLLLLLLLSS